MSDLKETALPWGPLYTAAALSTNRLGGEDITLRVVANINQKHGWNLTAPNHNVENQRKEIARKSVWLLMLCALVWLIIYLAVMPRIGVENGLSIGYVVTGLFLVMLYFISPWNKRY